MSLCRSRKGLGSQLVTRRSESTCAKSIGCVVRSYTRATTGSVSTPGLHPPPSTVFSLAIAARVVSHPSQTVHGQLRILGPRRTIRMSFGFSVGDFIAVGKLIVQISSALHESTGASAEYQSLLLRLDNLMETLRIADRSIRGSQLQISAANAILMHLSQCSAHLRKLNTIIEKHRKTLSKGGSGSKIRDSWRKIGWSLFTKEEIKEIDNALEGDVNFISMMLAMCGA